MASLTAVNDSQMSSADFGFFADRHNKMHTVITYSILLVNTFLIVVLLLMERRRPSATWAWILLILLSSAIGFMFYLTVGRSPRKRNLVMRKRIADERHRAELGENDTSGKNNDGWRWSDLVRLHWNEAGAVLHEGNDIGIFTDGNSKFSDLCRGLREARKSIHMEYYIFRDDETGREILSILEEKALEGLEVKIIHDGMGTWRLSRRFFSGLVRKGGRVACFFRPYIPPFRFQLKYRNHRKICIVDGKSAWLGGFNIGDEYRSRSSRFGYWRDTHLSISGPAVRSIEACFLLDWQFAARERGIILGSSVHELPHTGNSRMQIVSSGPDWKWNAIHNGFFRMITSAKRSIYIQTPYFIPDEPILAALRVAAMSGIDVRLMIPKNPDQRFVYGATMSYVGDIIDAGVRCFTYEKGFLHSKVICVDGEVASVGSANMDIRSFELNFEINAFIYDIDIVRQLEETFLADIEDCSEITTDSYAERGVGERMVEQLARLLSPLM